MQNFIVLLAGCFEYFCYELQIKLSAALINQNEDIIFEAILNDFFKSRADSFLISKVASSTLSYTIT